MAQWQQVDYVYSMSGSRSSRENYAPWFRIYWRTTIHIFAGKLPSEMPIFTLAIFTSTTNMLCNHYLLTIMAPIVLLT